jgi:dihydrofolate synthase/folylpolyglutamate synthase
VDFIFGLERFGMKLGLANMAALCRALDHPEAAFPSIIIAGTNGKGSVAAMADAALRAAGHRSARYTSPHLERIEERFVIDGREVEGATLESAAARVRGAIERLLASGDLEAPPTFFEAATAAAFELFRDARVDVAVLEVGLGGRLDATNVVTPVAAAIVSIDFDHEAQLGHTLRSIALEKAGVVKPGIPVVCGAMPHEALDAIARVCAERGATLIAAGGDAALAARVAAIPLSLRGEHQRANAAVAVRLLEAVDRLPSVRLPVGAAAIRAGLASASWPGRLESFEHRGCRVLVDAAHNPAGARALASYLGTIAPDGVTLVFGAMKDKAVAGMLEPLAPLARELICTTPPTPRAMDAGALALLARGAGIDARAVADPIDAVTQACARGRMVVVAGSIFLAGPVRAWLSRDILR